MAKNLTAQYERWVESHPSGALERSIAGAARFCKIQNLGREECYDLARSINLSSGRMKMELDKILHWNEDIDGPHPMEWDRFFILARDGAALTMRGRFVYLEEALNAASSLLERFINEHQLNFLPVLVVEAENDRDAFKEKRRKLCWIDGILVEE